MTQRKVFLLVVCLLLAACNLPQNLAGPQAWIDAPLDGSSLPLASYEIVFHAFAQGSPAAVELSINGLPVALQTGPDEPLMTVRYLWSPPKPGTYTLAARARDRQGTWGSPHVHTVTIGDPTPTPSPTETLTLTPTPTLTLTATPTPRAARLAFINTTRPDQVRYGTCSPNVLTFEVKADPADGVTGMVVFTRLQDQETGKNSGWDQGTALSPHGNGVFGRELNTNQLNGAGLYRNALLAYQFVATAAGGGILGRSPVYGDVTVTRCGIRVLPVPQGHTLTPSPTVEHVK
jgi:hypothetical protein